MAKVNKTKYAILGVLSVAPASGYDIKKFCDGSIRHFWNENYGHIYPVLKQLEQEGWATKQAEAVAGKPDRNVYSITEAGRKALKEWLMVTPEHDPARYEFLLKIFFSEDIPPAVLVQRLMESKVFCEGILEQYRQMEAVIAACMEEQPGKEAMLTCRLATLRYGLHDIQAKIDWCAETLERFRCLQKGSDEHETAAD